MIRTQITIGMFSTITRISKKQLRYFDSRGILCPKWKDKYTGYRYYSFDQIQTGIKVRTLHDLQFSIHEMKLFLELEQAQFQTKMKELIGSKLDETQKKIQELKNIEGILSENSKNSYDLIRETKNSPIIKEIPQLRVISRRVIGTYKDNIHEHLVGLKQEISHRLNLDKFVKVNGPSLLICHDEGYKEIDADFEVAIPVSGPFTNIHPLTQIKTLPPIIAVSYLHVGPFDKVGNAYRLLFQFLNENSFSIVGPSREIYLNYSKDINQFEFITEIQIPIEIIK
ncbi:GyrI-like domain-containing protein [Candidatus Lokiarchaeum ossiferum]|uniref:GyrI-like domain-containing protein n=1 Tax=Candidatus Lokiarchaeum ossiferum TaxID=2951803 RepID=UPI00352F20BB